MQKSVQHLSLFEAEALFDAWEADQADMGVKIKYHDETARKLIFKSFCAREKIRIRPFHTPRFVFERRM